jgi:hypothetical protein
VVNLSLGEEFGLADTPESQAADALAQLGTVVVAAAGNVGDIHFVSGMPGASPWSISVAASAYKLDEEEGFTPDLMASFSSRGPATFGNHFLAKPDLTGPGIDVVSANAFAFNPNQIAGARRGTSMATPHVAGVAALLRQQYPDWSVPELKAALMNTATHPVYRFAGISLPLMAPAQAGAGRIDPQDALESPSLAFDADHPERVSITFNTTEVLDTALEERTLRIWNRGDAPESYALRFVFRTFINGVTLRLSATQTAPVLPGESVDIGLRLDALASIMRNTRDAAARDGVNGLTRQWLNELSGNLVITPFSGAPPLHVPFYGVLRPVSAMSATTAGVDFSEAPDALIELTGEQLGPGTEDYSFEFVSLVTPLELLGFYPAVPENRSPARLKYIGVNSDYLARLEAPEGAPESARAFFGIAVHENWDTLNRYRYTIHLDMDQDGQADFGLYSSSNPLTNGSVSRLSDVHLVRLTDFEGQDFIAGYMNVRPPDILHTAPFFSNVLVMPLTLASVGWQAGRSFDFWVTAGRRGAPADELDVSEAFTWNPAEPGILFPQLDPDAVPQSDLNGVGIPVAFDAGAYARYGSLGVLLLHHHNAGGEKDQWLPAITSGDTDGDGILDAEEGAEDTDGDGLPNLLDIDSDGDGLSDRDEGNGDPDADGLPNFLDTDSDGDTLADRVENAAGTNPYNPDSDGDGRDDNIEGLSDFDGDGLLNALDPDSDEDGLYDLFEADGDVDGDGAENYLDRDADGDSLEDGEEGISDPDEDGLPNYLDTDSDGDGLEDGLEANAGTDPYASDSDTDGRPDGVEGLEDTDGDGIVDALDADSDDDRLEDAVEADGDADGDGIDNFRDPDSDGDTIPDGDEGLGDLDGDGVPNYLDTDSDGDGLEDRIEVEGGTDWTLYDTDRDGRSDGVEGLEDPDGDGVRNALDLDSDGDGLLDALEADGDADGDGSENFLDTDSDGDGISDTIEGLEDVDGDGVPNYLDLDSDGDTLLDRDEVTQYNTNPTRTDTDSDARRDDVELEMGTDPTTPDLPDPPQQVVATDGTYSGYVLIRWEPGLGNLDWRIWRASIDAPEAAAPITGWLTSLRYQDSTAAQAVYIPGSGCVGPTSEVTRYVYFVEARNGIGQSGRSGGDEGHRGRSTN